jgi:hypothetical protein
MGIKRPLPEGMRIDYEGEAIEIHMTSSGDIRSIRVTGRVIDPNLGVNVQEQAEYHTAPQYQRVTDPRTGLLVEIQTGTPIPMTLEEKEHLATCIRCLQAAFEMGM